MDKKQHVLKVYEQYREYVPFWQAMERTGQRFWLSPQAGRALKKVANKFVETRRNKNMLASELYRINFSEHIDWEKEWTEYFSPNVCTQFDFELHHRVYGRVYQSNNVTMTLKHLSHYDMETLCGGDFEMSVYGEDWISPDYFVSGLYWYVIFNNPASQELFDIAVKMYKPSLMYLSNPPKTIYQADKFADGEKPYFLTDDIDENHEEHDTRIVYELFVKNLKST